MSKKKKTNTGRPVMPKWLVARGALVIAALFFAAFTVVFWGLSLAEASLPLAIFVSIGFGLSAMVTPSVVPKLFHAKGFTFAGLFVTVVAFGAVDSVGLTLGFQGLEKQMTGPAYDAAVKAYSAERTDLETKRDDAAAKRDAIVLVKAFPNGQPFGPQRMAEARANYDAEREPLQKVVDDYESKIEALAVPVRAKLFDLTFVALLSTALQIALALGMVALEAAREGVYARAVDAYENRLAEQRAEREAKAKAKARAEAKAAKNAATIAKARAANGLKLAVDNES